MHNISNNKLCFVTGSTKQMDLLHTLLKRLHTDFPGDVGCFAPYFMNYLELRPGQAIFLKPNLPHAYLSGGNPIYDLYYLFAEGFEGSPGSERDGAVT